MRLNLQQIMHVPGASIPFAFQLDLSQEAFFGEYPISRPVTVTGHVKNVADVLMLEGEAKSLLDYTCDRCMCRFSREKAVRLRFLLAETLEGEDDDIVLLDQGEVDVGELAYTAFILDMDTKHLCSEDCKGLCPGCGVNLNQAPCRCKKQADPRWAALAQLINKNCVVTNPLCPTGLHQGGVSKWRFRRVKSRSRDGISGVPTGSWQLPQSRPAPSAVRIGCPTGCARPA